MYNILSLHCDPRREDNECAEQLLALADIPYDMVRDCAEDWHRNPWIYSGIARYQGLGEIRALIDRLYTGNFARKVIEAATTPFDPELDETPGQPSNSAILIATDILQTYAHVLWCAASDALTPQSIVESLVLKAVDVSYLPDNSIDLYWRENSDRSFVLLINISDTKDGRVCCAASGQRGDSEFVLVETLRPSNYSSHFCHELETWFKAGIPTPATA